MYKRQENGYWTDAYIPYTLMDGDTAAANISVNTMKTIWNGQIKNYIQLGTVMTAPSCRKQGLSRFLLEEIKKDWEGRCDGMYLFANNTVLDFYPRFGFSRQEQYQCSLPVLPQKGVIRKLSMDKPEDRRISVSYTHLDVYKRQVHARQMERIGLIIT